MVRDTYRRVTWRQRRPSLSTSITPPTIVPVLLNIISEIAAFEDSCRHRHQVFWSDSSSVRAHRPEVLPFVCVCACVFWM